MADNQRPDISELVQETGISEESLDQQCNDRDLNDIASLCDDWELIAHHIGLTEYQISAIKEEFRTPELRRIKFLQKWKQSRTNSTYKMIVNTFLRCEKARQAKKVCELIANNQSGGDSSEVHPSGINLTGDVEHSTLSCSYSSTVSESENSQSTMNRNVRDNMRALERKFSSVQRQFMKVHRATLEELQSCLATLPSFQSNSTAPLLHAATKNDFFHHLKDYCNVLDPEILEDLIEELGDEESKIKLNQFNEELTAFQRRTKLKDMIGNYDGPENIPPEYKELSYGLIIRLHRNVWRK